MGAGVVWGLASSHCARALALGGRRAMQRARTGSVHPPITRCETSSSKNRHTTTALSFLLFQSVVVLLKPASRGAERSGENDRQGGLSLRAPPRAPATRSRTRFCAMLQGNGVVGEWPHVFPTRFSTATAGVMGRGRAAAAAARRRHSPAVNARGAGPAPSCTRYAPRCASCPPCQL